jgi:hypothetical protein
MKARSHPFIITAHIRGMNIFFTVQDAIHIKYEPTDSFQAFCEENSLDAEHLGVTAWTESRLGDLEGLTFTRHSIQLCLCCPADEIACCMYIINAGFPPPFGNSSQ